MPGKRRKFIEKKNAVTYRLVPRCQLDPDGDASEHVLVPVNQSDHEKFNIKLPEAVLPPSAKNVPSLKKHLPVKGPRADWDPDIVAALDDDFNYEDSGNALEDDFITKANGPAGEAQPSDNESESGSMDYDSDGGFQFSDDESQSSFGHGGKDEKGSRFTQYSLTSAISNCTEEFKTFNERFEKFYETYDDDQIGALDFEEIEGGCITADSKVIESLAEDLEKHQKKLHSYDSCLAEDLKEKTLQYAQMDGKEKHVEVVIELPLEHDCQSILSLHSNKYNHPTLIKAEKKEKPARISAYSQRLKLTKSNLKQLDWDECMREEDEESIVSKNNESVISSFNGRPKGETPEEKRERKHALKQIRRENRVFKKQNKLIAGEEKRRLNAVALNEKKNRCMRFPS